MARLCARGPANACTPVPAGGRKKERRSGRKKKRRKRKKKRALSLSLSLLLRLLSRGGPRAKKLRVHFRRPRGGERAHPRPLDSRDKGCLIQGPTHTRTPLDPYTCAHECTRSSTSGVASQSGAPRKGGGTEYSGNREREGEIWLNFKSKGETFEILKEELFNGWKEII